MESVVRRTKLKLRGISRRKGWIIRAAGFFLLGLPAFAGHLPAQRNDSYFYNLDKEIRVEGIIRDVRFEPRYENTAPFLIVRLEERGTGKAYSVEISPSWFFDRDLHQGESLKVVGSLADGGGTASVLIAREVQCKGTTIAVRDRRGFPNWRGGRGRKRGPSF